MMMYVCGVILVATICGLAYATIENKRQIEKMYEKCKGRIGKELWNENSAHERIDTIELKPYAQKIRAMGEIDCNLSKTKTHIIGEKPQANICFDFVYVTRRDGIVYATTEKRPVVSMEVEDFINFAESLKGAKEDAERSKEENEN